MKISNNAYKNDSSTNPFNVKLNKYISKLKTKRSQNRSFSNKNTLHQENKA
ncbi:hypothetical protein N411_06675 [Helicobacter pylori FD535]|nr:hypothetical protein N411_06675 [Helicobacter pylori FD535]